MDPVSAIGAVASILQLAGTALSLSKSLYEVSTLLANASEDICSLARDLSLFSESLVLLSKMLEANKEVYSEGVYGLTAKIIVDCDKICKKIENLIKKCQKMGGWGGKFKWMVNERKVKALLGRLRDMKITLLVILSNLQLDRQLSLMSVPSASTLEKPLGQTQSLLQHTSESAGSSELPRSVSIPKIEITEDAATFDEEPLVVSTQGSSFKTGLRPVASIESFVTAVSFQEPQHSDNELYGIRWRNEIAKTASSHFNISDTEARAWASSLSEPPSMIGPEPRSRLKSMKSVRLVQGEVERKCKRVSLRREKQPRLQREKIICSQTSGRVSRAPVSLDSLISRPEYNFESDFGEWQPIKSNDKDRLPVSSEYLPSEDHDEDRLRPHMESSYSLAPKDQPLKTTREQQDQEVRATPSSGMAIPAWKSLSQMSRMALPEPESDFEYQFGQSRRPYPRSSSIASPMSIPHAQEPGPPPPLPPPRNLDRISSPEADIGWHWGNRENPQGNLPAPVKTGSSLLGASFVDGRRQYIRNEIPEINLKLEYKKPDGTACARALPLKDKPRKHRKNESSPDTTKSFLDLDMHSDVIPNQIESLDQCSLAYTIYTPQDFHEQAMGDILFGDDDDDDESLFSDDNDDDEMLLRDDNGGGERTLRPPTEQSYSAAPKDQPFETAHKQQDQEVGALSPVSRASSLQMSSLSMRSGTTLPDIFQNSSELHNRSNMTFAYTSSMASPISIPNSRESGPPPQNLDRISSPPTDLGWQGGNQQDVWENPLASVKTGSSLLGESSFEKQQQFLPKKKSVIDIEPTYDVRQKSGGEISAKTENICTRVQKSRLMSMDATKHIAQGYSRFISTPGSMGFITSPFPARSPPQGAFVEFRGSSLLEEVGGTQNSCIDGQMQFSKQARSSKSGLKMGDHSDVIPNQLKSFNQRSLWWRAYTKWANSNGDKNLSHLLKSSNLWPSEEKEPPEGWTSCITTFCTQQDLFNDENTRLMEVATVLKVVSESVGFNTASIPWASLAFLFATVRKGRKARLHIAKYEQLTTTYQLGKITSIVARYTVMENIYHRWNGMTLEPKFESELEHLCLCVLEYMDAAFNPLPPVHKSRQDLNIFSKFNAVMAADERCRGFNIFIETEGVRENTMPVEDISSEDSDEEFDTFVDTRPVTLPNIPAIMPVSSPYLQGVMN